MNDIAIGPSRPREADRLIANLASPDPVTREASVARLRVLGPPVIPRLASFIDSSADSTARVLAMSVLEGFDDPRAADIALAALASTDNDIVIGALGVLRGWVPLEDGTRLLEAITAIAIDHGRGTRVRRAAVDALSALPDDLVRPIRAQAPPPEAGGPPLDNPVAAHEWIDAHGANVTLAALHDAIKSFRELETRAQTNRSRDEWVRARGAAHRVLADRGSRLAVYDARETLSAAQSPLPPGFLEAVARVGDASCLEPLARAWSAAKEPRWRTELSEVARHIVARSKLTGRSAILKALRADWEGFV